MTLLTSLSQSDSNQSPVASTPSTNAVSKPAWKHFVAGNSGGIFGLALAYPLDTVKVRIQTRPVGTYKGIWDCMKTMSRTEGVSSLYRGLTSPVLGYGLIKSTAFGSYNQCKTFLSQQPHNALLHKGVIGEVSVFSLFVSGAFAGFVQTFVRCPIEQIKVVMQGRNRQGSSTLAPYASTWACVRDVVRTEGIQKGLYRSFTPTLSREIPQYAIYYPTYELTRLFLCQGTQTPSDLGPLKTALAGGTAGVVQWAPTYALDVIKSRVSIAPPGTYHSFWHAAVSIYKQEGAMVFFRGINAALIRAFPLHGAVFVGYELTMKVI